MKSVLLVALAALLQALGLKEEPALIKQRHFWGDHDTIDIHSAWQGRFHDYL